MLFAGVAVAAFCASAQAGALDQLRAFTANTKAARGEFVQTIEKSGRRQTSSGSFAFARPGKFRWAYLKPFEQVLVADGQRLWIYDKDLNQVTIRKLGSALGESPAAILFGDNALEKSFVLVEDGARDGLEWLTATPRGRDATFAEVSIGFRDGVPEAMSLRDAFGQVSHLVFRNLVRGPVGAESFAFVPPQGADIYQE